MPDLALARVRVVVRGRVQGVFFRDACREEAKAAGVSGWVSNRIDGSVEAAFEGPPAALERMVTWCRHGPPRARVDDIDVHPEAPIGEAGFRIR
ncbi:MAG: acylphosphatase [Actinomycetia bacterium]|nr:acylphosphatase [Actinomycetes bacterium]